MEQQRETGNRMIGWGALISEASIPVSGSPLSLMISLRVAGGSPRWRVAGVSIQSSMIGSALCPPSSVIDAAICSLKVAGGGLPLIWSSVSLAHWSTCQPASWFSPPANWPTVQLIN